MLHLVPKTPAHSYLDAFFQKNEVSTNPQETCRQRFLSDFQEVSPRLYSFHAHDARYDLFSSFLLDMQDILMLDEEKNTYDNHLVPMLVFDFPGIDGQTLYNKVFGDEYLQTVLMTRFYLNILESIFSFCEKQNAKGLIVFVDDNCLDVVDTYRNFISTEAQVITEKGRQTQIVFSINSSAYDDLADFIEKVDHNFHQNLWRNQKENPIMREYLKSYAVS